ncbi:General transcription factor II-I repeat domain-containing protein 2B [Anabarilius grahami]|uniref:General transcription factor II-I repeat domain-containing protein 2B n=1 Tax=Anabarilius grahami TaxID=495550 RepID=A0A3N0Y337_ANAGA|nr:General transcription factor II-I repeat domain-containing protein 2B [Anabarilius grahami]
MCSEFACLLIIIPTTQRTVSVYPLQDCICYFTHLLHCHLLLSVNKLPPIAFPLYPTPLSVTEERTNTTLQQHHGSLPPPDLSSCPQDLHLSGGPSVSSTAEWSSAGETSGQNQFLQSQTPLQLRSPLQTPLQSPSMLQTTLNSTSSLQSLSQLQTTLHSTSPLQLLSPLQTTLHSTSPLHSTIRLQNPLQPIEVRIFPNKFWGRAIFPWSEWPRPRRPTCRGSPRLLDPHWRPRYQSAPPPSPARLNSRQFKELLSDLESEYGDLVYHCEVRWLSRTYMLARFYKLREEVKQFMEIKGKPVVELSDGKWLCDLAFMVDITKYLSELNVKLQGSNQLLSSLLSNVKSFEVKLKLWQLQLEKGNTVHFPTLQEQKPAAEYAG